LINVNLYRLLSAGRRGELHSMLGAAIGNGKISSFDLAGVVWYFAGTLMKG
jgi:hypothetical protein